tara:strand:- start:260 stop:481 length:222 start_codon:yes stop_codon:yes gene_type:complete
MNWIHSIEINSLLLGFIMGIIVILAMDMNYYLRNNKHLFEWNGFDWKLVYEPADKKAWYKTKKIWKIVKRSQL